MSASTRPQVAAKRYVYAFGAGEADGTDILKYTSNKLTVDAGTYTFSENDVEPGLIFNHGGVSGVTEGTRALCRRLAKQGFVVFAPSYRGEDDSEGEIEVAVVTEPRDKAIPWWKLLFGQPVMASIIVVALLFAMVLFDGLMSTILAIVAMMWGVAAIAISIRGRGSEKVSWHSALEGRAGVFTTLVVIGILVGGVAEIIPMVI